MYNNYQRNYTPNYFNQQSMYDQIDGQINQLQQMKEQIKNNNQQPSINQTFQLAPNTHTMRYADTIDDVSKETIYYDTPFFSKDMSILWVKTLKGDIKTYELNEIVAKDDKDIQIELLQAQINEMKGMIENAKSNNTNDDEPVKNTKPSNVSNVRTSTKKSN
jgi:hypothetical protein